VPSPWLITSACHLIKKLFHKKLTSKIIIKETERKKEGLDPKA